MFFIIEANQSGPRSQSAAILAAGLMGPGL
jgi:hypothetical protein